MKTNMIKLAVVVSLSFALSACVVAPPRTVTYRMAPVVVHTPVTYVAAQPVVTQTQVTSTTAPAAAPQVQAPLAQATTTTTMTTAYQQPLVIQPAPVYVRPPVYVHAVAPVVYVHPRYYPSVYVGPGPVIY